MAPRSTREITESDGFTETVLAMQQNARMMEVLGQLDSAIFALAQQSQASIAAAVARAEASHSHYSNTPEARALQILLTKTGLAIDRMRAVRPLV